MRMIPLEQRKGDHGGRYRHERARRAGDGPVSHDTGSSIGNHPRVSPRKGDSAKEDNIRSWELRNVNPRRRKDSIAQNDCDADNRSENERQPSMTHHREQLACVPEVSVLEPVPSSDGLPALFDEITDEAI